MPTATHQKRWLGYQDSNLGMPGSKPGALPLGDIPTDIQFFCCITLFLSTATALCLQQLIKKDGWDTRIRTWECQDQNLVPYRLAISQLIYNSFVASLYFCLQLQLYAYSNSSKKMAGIPGFEPGNARIKTWCLTAWRYPIRCDKPMNK